MGFREQKKGWCEISASFRRVFGDIFEVLGVNFSLHEKRAEKPLKTYVARVFLILIHIEITSFFIFEV